MVTYITMVTTIPNIAKDYDLPLYMYLRQSQYCPMHIIHFLFK